MDEVRKPSAQVAAMAEHWAMIDALMGGTGDMRKAGERYLPRFPRETDTSFAARLKTATLFPAYERTVSILVGKPFSKPVSIDEKTPPRIAELLQDVDREGRNLHTFAASVAADLISHGQSGILIDCPPNPAVTIERRIPSVEEERAAGIRPYFVHVRPQQVLGWRAEARNGRQSLTQLRLLETVEVPDGPFAVKMVEQVRLLEPGRWATFRKSGVDGRETWTVFEHGTTSLDEIPYVPLYGKREAFMVGRPPMLELAFANVEHWQSKSDQQNILRVARCPILFARGLGDSEITVGADSFVRTGSETAELKFVEHTGAAIEAGRDSILDLEDRMRQAGAELLIIKPGNSTRVQVMAENEQAKCDLQCMVQALEGGLDQAVGFLAQWIGETAEPGNVDVYDDFGAATLEEASASMLFGMQQAGSLSHATLLGELQRRGILSADLDPEEEMKTAAAEHDARQDAEMKRQETIKAG